MTRVCEEFYDTLYTVGYSHAKDFGTRGTENLHVVIANSISSKASPW
jgi:hypothetical protein